MKEHKEIRDLLSLAAAGVLDSDEQRRVEEHLLRCEACRAELNGWMSLASALEKVPTPQAPPDLVPQTRRLLERHSALASKRRETRLLPALVVFSWAMMILNFGLVRLLDAPLTRLLTISSATLWVAYIGITWLTTAVAAGLLVKHARQEGRTL